MQGNGGGTHSRMMLMVGAHDVRPSAVRFRFANARISLPIILPAALYRVLFHVDAIPIAFGRVVGHRISLVGPISMQDRFPFMIPWIAFVPQ